MGLFDALAGQATQALGDVVGGALGGGAQELATPENLQKLVGWVGGSAESGGLGGLGGLVAQFSQHGLGDLIGSWTGSGAAGGAALPISVDQLSAVLGNEQVQSVARALGFEPAQALTALTALLPQVVKLLSAGGEGGAGGLLAQGASLLGGFGGFGGLGGRG